MGREELLYLNEYRDLINKDLDPKHFYINNPDQYEITRIHLRTSVCLYISLYWYIDCNIVNNMYSVDNEYIIII